ncbi:protein of unknown function DUF1016 [Candidatus Scalindua japonica]|uniref:YhcG N-terminal domain-containing protein n=1 Tax=Candidatus Scalindua japonica TaxID=1284222 RepID=A0A286TVF0_9BACT|nr:protein of unknown function DUF1016 [Candidatus Scalindua japonica]
MFPIGAAVRRQLPVCVQRTGRSEKPEKGASLRHFSDKQEKSPSTSTQGIVIALRKELTWTHYKLLIRVENEDARLWYMNEAADCNWSTRALERQINSLYYERLLSSQDKKPVKEEAKSNISQLQIRPEDVLKDPYVLEFLNLRDRSSEILT